MKKIFTATLSKVPGSGLTLLVSTLVFIVVIFLLVSGLFFILPVGTFKMNLGHMIVSTEPYFKPFSIFLYGLLALQLIHRFTVPMYNSNGTLSRWYSGNLKVVKPSYVADWFNAFIPQHVGDKERLIIASPSANRGVHELSIFDGLRNTYDVNFIASDLADIPDHVGSVNYESSVFKYVPNRNALDLAAVLSENGVTSVDVIFDMKGALWHSSLHKKLKTKDVLDVYKSVLSENGVIVTDAFKTNSLMVILSHLIPFMHMSEDSTYYKLRRWPWTRKILNEQFLQTIHHLPSESNKPFLVLKPIRKD
jgi:hypothetical protein